MKRKNQQEISAAMTMAGALTNFWALLDKMAVELGGQPEDLYPLRMRENPDIIALTEPMVRKLVALGNESRATRKMQASPIPPQFSFSPKLQPKHLFLINKNGANAEALVASMDGKYFASDYAKGMMREKHFIIGPPEISLVGVFTCAQLGVTGWLEMDFFGQKGYEHVKKFGLVKCLTDDALYIRHAHSKQEFGEWIRVAHDPIPYDGYSSVFALGLSDDHGQSLHGYHLNASARLHPGYLVALRLAS